jgi:hypothetical protein
MLEHIGLSTILSGTSFVGRGTWMLFRVIILAVLSVKRRCLLSVLSEDLKGGGTIGCLICL